LHTDGTVKNLAIVLNDLRLGRSYGGYYGGYRYGGYGYGYYEEESKDASFLNKMKYVFGRNKRNNA
jgi:hypothetical protein